MLENLTERARRTLFFARYEAVQAGALAIGSEHLLLGLLREPGRRLIGEAVADLQGRGLALDVTPETAEWLLAHAGGEQAAGARPLRRMVQRVLEGAVPDHLISHRETGEGSLRTQVEDGRLVVAAAEGTCAP